MNMAADGIGPITLPMRDRVSSPGPLSPGPPSPLGSAARNLNPLSNKLTSVLSTSYVDSEFRDALALLDQRGVSNSAETRRRLRLDVQKEVIDSNGEIIAEFGRVAEQLKRIGSTIDKLNTSYQGMKSHVTAAHEVTSTTLEETNTLMTQRRNVETKQQLLNSFRDHFILSEDETASLTLTAEPVDDHFFAVLTKAKRIRKDCEILLGFENQTLGLDVMDQTSKSLNLAFQKLYRWIQKEFKTLNLENPQINSSVRRALRVLAERPSLFQNCLDFFAEAREQILSDSFYLALTGTSASGVKDHSVKPIELAAHDPLRYVGDMLAWTHSATVSEREALEVLFVSDGNEIAKGIQEGRENEPWQLIVDDADGPLEFDAVKALNDLVDRDVSGAARILRQRVEQVIQTNEDTILAYKLANLLNFYRVTFAKLLGAQSVLLEAMANLESEALRQFRSLMRDYIATLQGEFQHPPSDLGPPDFLQDALKQLSAIMRTYETSLSSLSSADDREADFQPILAESLDPFLSGCEHMARSLDPSSDPSAANPASASTSTSSPSSSPWDASVFLVNCLLAAHATVAPFDFGRQRARRLQAAIDEQAARLAESQYAFFRAESALEPLLAALAPLRPAAWEGGEQDENDDEEEEVAAKMRRLDALRPDALAAAAQGLDDFLPSAVMDAMENVKHLQDARLARDITERAADRFCADFERVEELLILADGVAERQESSGGGEGEEEGAAPRYRSLFPRTTGEIRVLLS
ncbi:Golgi transport complex subunit 6 [Diatrype stigma]|uniref:Conserved oligomeric Golgi complex subunit 6 n=1 Tax=Diatrype stigma TaxID=117547 RepID=A0AAN9YPE5_9PEZI